MALRAAEAADQLSESHQGFARQLPNPISGTNRLLAAGTMFSGKQVAGRGTAAGTAPAAGMFMAT